MRSGEGDWVSSPEKSFDFIVTFLHMFLFVFVKPGKQRHDVREGGSVLYIYFDLCIVHMYVCVIVPVKNWRREQRIGPCSQHQHPISSIPQHLFGRSSSFPVS